MISFKYKNIPVEIRTGFFIIITFMLLISENETVIISLLSSVFHECGHLLAIVFSKEKPKRIVFSASGMRIDRYPNSFLSFSKEIVIALSGVFVNFLISFMSYIAFCFSGSDFFFKVFGVNLVIGIFNILPLEELDGAVCLNFFLLRRIGEEKAKVTVDTVSVIFGIVLISFFSVTVYFKKVNLSFAVVIIYLLILMLNRILELKKTAI